MGSKRDIREYSNYRFEDFLQDDFFVASILHPTGETELFWKNFLGANAGKTGDFRNAARCIGDINRDVLAESDAEEIWHNIRATRKRAAQRTLVRTGVLAAAASIALFFILRLYLFTPAQHPGDLSIREFAAANIPDAGTTETQLILSADRVISLSDRESLISYDSASIRVSSRTTAREEIPKSEAVAFHQLVVPGGKRSFLTLSDGTGIWINSATTLVYPSEFEADRREIFVDGEIYLDVQPDHARPFIVRTVDMDVQVLGTEFNVQAYSTDMRKRVVLKSGAVMVASIADRNDDGQQPFHRLQPSYMYELSGCGETVTRVDVNTHTSWVNGIYICDGERLGNMLTWLSRYYGKEIIADGQAAGLRCNGKLNLKDDIDDVLKIISFIAPVACTRENGTYKITFNP